ncbi:unnamed protein product [Blepharisma stoltei]|uniref:Uncharacterized protein n=1 Tax=Blepharisma stoltei TaxID=1481888 RepID=A0AAU9J7M4_9CILI|nr:unnamed protein product [Blepharisma stoltei]
MSKTKLYSQLNGYASIMQTLKELETDGHYDAIFSCLSKVYENKPSSQKESFKENLKVIIENMINVIWSQSIELTTANSLNSPFTSPYNSYEKLEQPKLATIDLNNSPTAEKKPIKISSYKPMSSGEYDLGKYRLSYANLKKKKNESSIFSSLKGEDLALLSDFSYPSGAATFNRERRRLNEIREISPGPGSYETDPEYLRKKSPKAVIPHGGKRIDFAKADTPGPLDYYPLRHYLSKY